MLAVTQSFSDGEVEIINMPAPLPKDNEIIIETRKSLISAGTERNLLDFGKSNIIQKIKKQPEKVNQVLNKAKTDGLINTYEAIKNKLNEPTFLGYCNVGVIKKLGKNVKKFSIGDRVISNGPHAEVISVTENLCAKIPENVEDEQACFTVLASIGLQGIRLANPTFGETILVSGLGLIGLLTCQLLKANGCEVLAIDPDLKKCELANSFGIETFHLKENTDALSWCYQKTSGVGLDAVIVTASTKSNQPIELAAKVSRKRGRIILVGVIGLDLKRDLFYKKELTFQVSCSYGPGRYDDSYEIKGNDYPIAFIRWTEQRNFEAVLNAMKKGIFSTKALITKKFDLKKVKSAYDYLLNNPNTLGLIINYPKRENKSYTSIKITRANNTYKEYSPKNPVVGIIGAGNYSKRFLVPLFSKAGANLKTIVASNGLSPIKIAKEFGFEKASTDINDIFNDKDCNTVIIATRHDSHANLLIKALEKGKNVFVEKPLCLNKNELKKIKKVYKEQSILMIGYNRRFSNLIKKLREKLLTISSPKAFVYTCNAGELPSNHWLNDSSIGGGRLIGEACHFVDLLRFLAESPIAEISLNEIKEFKKTPENFTINIRFKNNSIGTIHYFSNGHKGYPKEKIEVFTEGKIFQVDNFRSLKTWGVNGYERKRNIFYQDKGQLNCIKSFIHAIRNGEKSPILFNEIYEIQNLILEAIKS